MKKIRHGILNEPDIGCCPSCKTLMALPRLMNLDKLQSCPVCHASSYGYKWLSDNGKAAVSRLLKFKQSIEETYDKTTKI